MYKRQGENELALTIAHETELKETVEVRSSAAQIDPAQTAHQDGLVQRDILDTPVPNSHDLKQNLAAIPQVVTDNTSEIHFAGARAGETEMLLDGFEIGDPATGTLDARVDVDSVRPVSYTHLDVYKRQGWHSFRHSYSTLLRSLQVDLKVQQELLRHSDIRTTMNIYTQAVPDAMREANSRVVEMVIPNRKVG